ncbi:phage terminase large subunit family protein [Blautia schinkii]|nr:phage terminase large subunit family protein [Blautia schinkii]
MNKEVQVDIKTVQLFREVAKAVAPPPLLTVSEWADSYRRLSAEAAAEPGQWNTDRAPYQRAIMDAVNDAEVEEIVIKSSAQVGKTELILNVIGFFIDYDPAPILVLQPTLDMAQAFSKDRLAPMIRDTPALHGKVKDVRSRDSGNTILHKKFPGGHVTIAGANSASSLASRPIRIVLMDEIDRYPASAGTEGNPIKLAEKRTATFWNRKKIKVSTPTDKLTSQIEKEYETGTMEEWNVPCPCCGKYQPYEWARVHFSDVTMECKFCTERFSEVDWKAGEGKYIAEHPERKKKRSFHLNELASPWKHWEEIIEEFKDANRAVKESGDVERLKVWINTTLGEAWEERGESADDDSLLNRRERYMADLPEGVLLVTAGIDVQDDRFEVEITGWGRGYESWGIKYEKIFGDLEKEETWAKLEEYLDRELYFEDGHSLLIACSCIDTGGHFTTQTYKFLKRMERKNKRIYGIKGMGGPGLPLIYKLSTNNNLKVKVFILGVDSGKEILMTRLKTVDEGPGFCHFPINKDRGYDETYIKGLNSEQRVIQMKDGRPVMKWVKKTGTRNEPLDLRNYSTAAAEILRPDWEVLERKVKAGINYMKRQPKKKSARSGTVSRGIQL